MASGHGYRANRPNTWLTNAASEDSSCQPGAVHTWPQQTVGHCGHGPMLPTSDELSGILSWGG
jgi:hypothetical protein